MQCHNSSRDTICSLIQFTLKRDAWIANSIPYKNKTKFIEQKICNRKRFRAHLQAESIPNVQTSKPKEERANNTRERILCDGFPSFTQLRWNDVLNCSCILPDKNCIWLLCLNYCVMQYGFIISITFPDHQNISIRIPYMKNMDMHMQTPTQG